MKRIYSEPHPIFIHRLKDSLEEQHISCFIKNEYLSGGVGELPAVETWPELWVVEDMDVDRAQGLVNEFIASTNSKTETWDCEKCGETVEGQFNMCWKCGSTIQQ